MAALSSLYSSVRLYAQQCPDTTIDKFLIEAIREFCRETGFYQETLTMNIVAAQSDYTLTPTSSQELIGVEWVKVDGSPVTATRKQDVAEYPDDYSYTAYSFQPNDTLTVYPEPEANITNGLEARVIIMPPESTTTIPDSIYRHFKEGIVQGALSYILGMQNEAWSNERLSIQMKQMFALTLNRAKADKMRGFVSRPLSVKQRPFLI